MAVSCPALVLGTELRVEEMAQQLRAFDVLLEDPGSGPSTHMAAHQLSVIPVPGDPVPSSDFHRHQAHMWYIDIHANRIFKIIHLFKKAYLSEDQFLLRVS